MPVLPGRDLPEGRRRPGPAAVQPENCLDLRLILFQHTGNHLVAGFPFEVCAQEQAAALVRGLRLCGHPEQQLGEAFACGSPRSEEPPQPRLIQADVAYQVASALQLRLCPYGGTVFVLSRSNGRQQATGRRP